MLAHGTRTPHLLRLGLALVLCGCDGANEQSKPEPAAAAPAGLKPQPKPTPVQAESIAPPAPSQTAVAAKLAAEQTNPATTAPVASLSSSARTEDERNTTSVFKTAAPATVFVTQSQVVFDRFSMRAAEVPAGTGTGFIWDNKGHVVTNCHVALPNCRLRSSDKQKLKVTLYDQKEYPAEIVGFDPAKDIAVLKIDAPKSTTVALRRPNSQYELEVGQKTNSRSATLSASITRSPSVSSRH